MIPSVVETAAAVATLDEIRRQRDALWAAGRSAVFVVMDGATFRTVVGPFADSITRGGGARLLDLVAVVLPTDGIPLLRVVSDPVTECLGARPASGDAAPPGEA